MPRPRRALLSDESGATLVEYAAIIGLVVGVIVAGLYALRGGLNRELDQTSGRLDSPAAPKPADAPPAPHQPTFSDDFKDAKATKSHWELSGTAWHVTGGQLHAQETHAKAADFAWAKDSKGGDYRIATEAMLVKGQGYGVYCRATGGGKFSGYSFEYLPGDDGGRFVLRKWVQGFPIDPPLASAEPKPGYQWLGVRRHVEVSAVGSELVAKVDGRVVVTAHDASYKTGEAGLGVRGNGQARFYSFSVTPLGDH